MITKPLAYAKNQHPRIVRRALRVWDANAVSKQCGAAVMLKGLVEAGHIAAPA